MRNSKETYPDTSRPKAAGKAHNLRDEEEYVDPDPLHAVDGGAGKKLFSHLHDPVLHHDRRRRSSLVQYGTVVEDYHEDHHHVPDTDDHYSWKISAVFMLNLLLGSGPLLLPNGFMQAGFILSSFFLAFLCLICYTTATFIVECMAIANFVEHHKHHLVNEGDGEEKDEFFITRRYEIGELGEVFLPKWGQYLTFISLFVHTYGTLSVYTVTVVQSFDKLFPFTFFGISSYYVAIILFGCIVVPFSMRDFQGTKGLQIVIVAIRVLVYLTMLFCVMTFDIDQSKWDLHGVIANVGGVPTLFGVSILSFMIHHSIPGLVYPVRPQHDIAKSISIPYTMSCIALIALCYFAIAAYGDVKTACPTYDQPCAINELFNLNFSMFHVFGTFVNTYPLLMVALFPLVAISLRNNLLAFAHLITGSEHSMVMYALYAAVPPLVIACFTNQVASVTTYTAGYGGLTLMLIIPSWCVLQARKMVRHLVPEKGHKNFHASPCNDFIARFCLGLALFFMLFNTAKLALF